MGINRRNFLKTAGGLALLTIVPSRVLGGPKHVAPSDQLTKGIIGVGGIGRTSYHFTSDERCRLVAICDVDKDHLASALELGKQKFGQTLKTYHFYRDLINDPNVDIVHIATPPPLARHHGRRGRTRREGHLVRKAHDPHDRRGQARHGGRQAERTHLPPEHLVPLHRHLLRSGHDGRAAEENSSTAACSDGP